MNFAAGLYAAPCVRLDRLRPNGGLASAYVSSLSETDLIVPGGQPAFVRVVGSGTVPVLLTVYRLEHMPAPELLVRVVEQQGAAADSAGPGPQTAEPARALLVHVERQGDLSVAEGDWGGTPGSGHAIEGFALTAPASLSADAVEYQGALGMEWDTPWFRPDEFCGSRGMMLPLLGVRIRVTGEAAARTICRYWGSFVGHGEQGPFTQGELCAWQGATLEALRVVFVAAEEEAKLPPRRRRLMPSRR